LLITLSNCRRNIPITPEESFAHATAWATLTQRIATQRAKVGEDLLTAVSGIETSELNFFHGY
jgi:hypothetical protein